MIDDGSSDEGEFGLQIAPMLGVMFVLLMFFMIAAGTNAGKEGELGIKIPDDNKTPAGNTTAPQPLVLRIDAAGGIFLNNHAVAAPGDLQLAGLRGQIKDAISATGVEAVPVVIAPDPQTRHTRVIQVLDACSYANVKRLTFRYPGSNKGS